MRVAVVAPDAAGRRPGGISVVTRQVLRQLARWQAETDAWILHDPAGASLPLGEGVSLRDFRGFESSKGRMLFAALRCRERYDLVLTTHIGLGAVARALRRRGTRLVQYLMGVECWRRLPWRQAWGMRATDALLSISAFTLRRFVEHNPSFRRIPAAVCWPAAEPVRLAETPVPSVAEDLPSVLIVSRLVREEGYKGHRDLIDVWPAVRRAFPRACLDLVGEGNLRPVLEDEARNLGLADGDAVRFWGRLPDDELRERFRRCTVFAMPSAGEGFGFVYLEAMSCGRPCIASRDDAAQEIVVDGKTGLLVRHGDRAELEAAILRLFGDAGLRRRLGEAGRARFEELFAGDRFSDRFWASLHSLGVIDGPAGGDGRHDPVGWS